MKIGFLNARWMLAIAAAAAIAMWPAWIGWGSPGTHEELPVGQQAKLDFSLKDTEGKVVRLSDYRGRPLILNFWATWCGPCKVEIPAFIELVDKYRDQKLTVLGISVDDASEDLRQFAVDYKMNYPVLVGLGQDELQETYDAMVFVPITWFIRPDGTIMLKHPGPATKEWFEKQVRSLIGVDPVS